MHIVCMLCLHVHMSGRVSYRIFRLGGGGGGGGGGISIYEKEGGVMRKRASAWGGKLLLGGGGGEIPGFPPPCMKPCLVKLENVSCLFVICSSLIRFAWFVYLMQWRLSSACLFYFWFQFLLQYIIFGVKRVILSKKEENVSKILKNHGLYKMQV